jgi:hypothetical protein
MAIFIGAEQASIYAWDSNFTEWGYRVNHTKKTSRSAVAEEAVDQVRVCFSGNPKKINAMGK